MPKTISCPHAGCDYLFSKPVHLRRHLLSHSDEAVWRCPDCDQEFKRIDSFQRHKKRIHPDQPNLIAVKIGGSSGTDGGIKSDEDAEDSIDQLDVSIPDVSSSSAVPPQRSTAAAQQYRPSSTAGSTPSASHHLTTLDSSSNHSPSSHPNNGSSASAYSPASSSRPLTSTASSAGPSASSYYSNNKSQHYHPYLRNDGGSSMHSTPQSSAQDSWQQHNGQSQMYGASAPTSSATTATATSTAMPVYPNLYGPPISYNDCGSNGSSTSGMTPAAGYGQVTADNAAAAAGAPLSIASLTAPSPSWGSSSNSDTEGQNFFDDILQSILMDSISSFVPHETMAANDFNGIGGSVGMATDAFGFADPSTQAVTSAQQLQTQQTDQQMQSLPHHMAVLPNHQQQQAQSSASGSASHPLPQPLTNLVPFATFTESAHNSARSTPAATPRHAHHNVNMDDAADELARSVEKVGDQAATNIGARTRDLVLHGVNIPKKPPRLTAASLFSAALVIPSPCCRFCHRIGSWITDVWQRKGPMSLLRCLLSARSGNREKTSKHMEPSCGSSSSAVSGLVPSSTWINRISCAKQLQSWLTRISTPSSVVMRAFVANRFTVHTLAARSVESTAGDRHLVPRWTLGRVFTASSRSQHFDGAGRARSASTRSDHQQALSRTKELARTIAWCMEAVGRCGRGESQHDLPQYHRVASLRVSFQSRSDA